MEENWRLTADIWRNITDECADLNVISSLSMSNSFFYYIMKPSLDYKKLCLDNQLCRLPGESWFQACNQLHHLYHINACGRFIYCKDSDRFGLVFETFILITGFDLSEKYLKYIPITSRILMVNLINRGKTLVLQHMDSLTIKFIDIDSNTVIHTVTSFDGHIWRGHFRHNDTIHSPYFPYEWTANVGLPDNPICLPESFRNARNTEFTFLHGENNILYLMDVREKKKWMIPYNAFHIIDFLPKIRCVFVKTNFIRIYNIDTDDVVFEEKSSNGKVGWEIINDYIIHDIFTGRVAYYDERISQFLVHPETLGDIIYGIKGPVDIYKKSSDYQNFIYIRPYLKPGDRRGRNEATKILMLTVDRGNLKYRRFKQENGVFPIFEKLYEDIKRSLKTIDGDKETIIRDVFNSWYGALEKKCLN
ncbi:unnamed protein product [Bursaphelenchus xylophilus]|uniref:(pine wood nematode) hypothetical protein n=1 Tax=Bursaphelenchus xylophilus TaxID=6326 RepID=A0A1I7RI10_BURXY|nr:unnamed protein product [Bursaphelenchus xylophilus]CAG9115239.1 unnamed protein product [Bursaphelenchus xylophilus]